jgi:3-oxoacyl-[acyl-carrier-protein] synthase II
MRIVVTGMGLVSPLGCGVEAAWSRLLARRSGLRRLTDDVVPDVACKVGGVVPWASEDPAGFDPDQWVPPRDQKRMDRFIQFAIAAADEALAQAGWKPSTDAERERTATIIASGIGGFPVLMQAAETVATAGARRLSPFTVPSFLVNLAAGHVSIRHGFKGPLGAPVTACAASVQALGDAARLIRSGEADVAVAGGSEACIHRVSLGAFGAARALSTGFNDAPEQASRPFDAARDGFVMGEGAGILVLEELDHALARGARPLAELVGYGTTADAYHITSGPEDGSGAARAMRIALASAGLRPGDVQHLNAHSTSTPVGDAGELAAVASVFGRDGGIAISATKSATGHLLGAAGGLEAIFTVLALRDQIAPPTLNLTDPDPAAEGLRVVTDATPIPMEHALSNGFGFGGVNASVLFRRVS